MRKLILKTIAFIIMLTAMGWMTMFVFRGPYPLYWIITLLTWAIILIIFPYEQFFNIKNKK